MSQRHPIMKWIASTVVFTFFVTNLGITPEALAAAPLMFSPQGVVGQAEIMGGGALAIPAEFGQVTDTVTGNPKAPAFIHIQSAHGNFQAEKNIENLLRFIEKNSSVKLMLLEGATDKLHPELFRLFPKHPDFNRKVTDKLMQEGYLTGPEVFMIENLGERVTENDERNVPRSTFPAKRAARAEMQAFGIEDLAAYKKDREAFISVAKKEKTAEKFLGSLRASIDKRFSAKLNKDLLNLVRQEEAFGSGTVSFEGWLKALGEGSKKHLKVDLSDAFYQGQYPFLVRYYRLQAIGSKIDQDKAIREAELFLNELKERKISPEIVQSFNDALIGERGTGNANVSRSPLAVTHAEGFSRLRRAFDITFEKLPKDFSMKAWPNWTLYAQHIILMQELESKGLQEEIVCLKENIQISLATTAEEKEYLAQARQLYLLRRLFNLELTRSEYEELNKRMGDGGWWMATNTKPAPSSLRLSPSKEIDAVYQSAMNFYSTAIVREQRMFTNALKRMSDVKAQRAVIVTGGFHADGLKALAAAKGCSYVQITPRINEVTKRDHEVYLRSILGSRDIETSQMSGLLALVDRAQRVAVTGAVATKVWARDVHDLLLGMINSEFNRFDLNEAFSHSVFGSPAPVSAPVIARAELRLTDAQENEYQDAIKDLQPPKWWSFFIGDTLDASVRRAAAARTLGRLKDPRAVSALTVALKDDAWFVRDHAAQALELIRTSNVLLVDLASPRRETNEALGVEVIAGALRKAYPGQTNVQIVDTQFGESVESVLEKIKKERPGILGLSVKIGSYESARKILGVIFSDRFSAEDRPLVVLGNTLSTFAHGKLLEQYPDIIAVVGEGEVAMTGIVKVFMGVPPTERKNIPFVIHALQEAKVPQLAFNVNGKKVETLREPVSLEAASMPSRDTLKAVVERGGIVTIEGSRGCPWGVCTFCAAKHRSKKWRPFPIEKVIEELKSLSSQGVKNVYFVDEDFVGPANQQERTITLANKIIEAKKAGTIDPAMKFSISTRVAAIYLSGRTGEQNQPFINLFRLLKTAGLDIVFLGIESGSDGQLKRFHKGVSAEENAEAVAILGKLGITVEAGFIMFDPYMTLAELKENIDFLERTGLANTSSKVTGALREQAGSAFGNSRRDDGAVLDIDSLSYPSQFKDETVNQIFGYFKSWEDETKDLVYALQGTTRGNASDAERAKAEELLIRLRRSNLNFLKACVAVQGEASEVARVRVGAVSERGGIFSEINAAIQNGTLSDDEGFVGTELIRMTKDSVRAEARLTPAKGETSRPDTVEWTDAQENDFQDAIKDLQPPKWWSFFIGDTLDASVRRAAAARTLGRLKDPRAVPALRVALKDDAWFVRDHAAQALKLIGDSSGVPFAMTTAEQARPQSGLTFAAKAWLWTLFWILPVVASVTWASYWLRSKNVDNSVQFFIIFSGGFWAIVTRIVVSDIFGKRIVREKRQQNPILDLIMTKAPGISLSDALKLAPKAKLLSDSYGDFVVIPHIKGYQAFPGEEERYGKGGLYLGDYSGRVVSWSVAPSKSDKEVRSEARSESGAELVREVGSELQRGEPASAEQISGLDKAALDYWRNFGEAEFYDGIDEALGKRSEARAKAIPKKGGVGIEALLLKSSKKNPAEFLGLPDLTAPSFGSKASRDIETQKLLDEITDLHRESSNAAAAKETRRPDYAIDSSGLVTAVIIPAGLPDSGTHPILHFPSGRSFVRLSNGTRNGVLLPVTNARLIAAAAMVKVPTFPNDLSDAFTDNVITYRMKFSQALYVAERMTYKTTTYDIEAMLVDQHEAELREKKLGETRAIPKSRFDARLTPEQEKEFQTALKDLESDSVEKQNSAIQTLRKLNDPRALPALTRLIEAVPKSFRDTVRATRQSILGSVGEPERLLIEGRRKGIVRAEARAKDGTEWGEDMYKEIPSREMKINELDATSIDQWQKDGETKFYDGVDEALNRQAGVKSTIPLADKSRRSGFFKKLMLLAVVGMMAVSIKAADVASAELHSAIGQVAPQGLLQSTQFSDQVKSIDSQKSHSAIEGVTKERGEVAAMKSNEISGNILPTTIPLSILALGSTINSMSSLITLVQAVWNNWHMVLLVGGVAAAGAVGCLYLSKRRARRGIVGKVRKRADLWSSDTPTRAGAAFEAGELRDRSTVLQLIKLLRDTSAFVRQSASWSLGRLDNIRAVPALIRVLETDSSDQVKINAAIALGRLLDERAVPALVRAMDEKNDMVRRAASYALVRLSFGNTPILEANYAVEDGDSIRVASTKAKDLLIVPVFIKGLTDSDQDIRKNSILGLEVMRDPSAIPSLEKPPSDSDPVVTAMARHALQELRQVYRNFQDEAVQKAIKELQPSKGWNWFDVNATERRSVAAEKLGKWKDSRSIPELKEASKDKDYWVREAATEAIELIENSFRVDGQAKTRNERPENAGGIRAEARAKDGTEWGEDMYKGIPSREMQINELDAAAMEAWKNAEEAFYESIDQATSEVMPPSKMTGVRETKNVKRTSSLVRRSTSSVFLGANRRSESRQIPAPGKVKDLSAKKSAVEARVEGFENAGSFGVGASLGTTALLSSPKIQWVRNLAISEIPELTENQIQSWTDEQMQALTEAQIQALTDKQIQAWGWRIQALTEPQVQALKEERIHSLGSNIQWLSKKQIRALGVRVQTLPETQIQALTEKQIQALAKDQIQGLTAKQLQVLKESQIQALQDWQIQSLTKEQIQGLSEKQISALTREQIQAMTEEQRKALRTVVDKFSSGTDADLSKEAKPNRSVVKYPSIDPKNLKGVWSQFSYSLNAAGETTAVEPGILPSVSWKRIRGQLFRGKEYAFGLRIKASSGNESALARLADLQKRLRFIASKPTQLYLPSAETFHIALGGIYPDKKVTALSEKLLRDALESVRDQISKGSLAPFKIKLKGVRRTDNGTIVVDLEENPSLGQLREIVGKAMVKAGWNPNQTKVSNGSSGIITVGRIVPSYRGSEVSMNGDAFQKLDEELLDAHERISENPIELTLSAISFVRPGREFLSEGWESETRIPLISSKKVANNDENGDKAAAVSVVPKAELIAKAGAAGVGALLAKPARALLNSSDEQWLLDQNSPKSSDKVVSPKARAQFLLDEMLKAQHASAKASAAKSLEHKTTYTIDPATGEVTLVTIDDRMYKISNGVVTVPGAGSFKHGIPNAWLVAAAAQSEVSNFRSDLAGEFFAEAVTYYNFDFIHAKALAQEIADEMALFERTPHEINGLIQELAVKHRKKQVHETSEMFDTVLLPVQESNDEDPKIRSEAREASAEDEFQHALKDLRDPEWNIRLSAIENLGEMRDLRAVAALEEILRGSDQRRTTQIVTGYALYKISKLSYFKYAARKNLEEAFWTGVVFVMFGYLIGKAIFSFLWRSAAPARRLFKTSRSSVTGQDAGTKSVVNESPVASKTDGSQEKRMPLKEMKDDELAAYLTSKISSSFSGASGSASFQRMIEILCTLNKNRLFLNEYASAMDEVVNAIDARQNAKLTAQERLLRRETLYKLFLEPLIKPRAEQLVVNWETWEISNTIIRMLNYWTVAFKNDLLSEGDNAFAFGSIYFKVVVPRILSDISKNKRPEGLTRWLANPSELKSLEAMVVAGQAGTLKFHGKNFKIREMSLLTGIGVAGDVEGRSPALKLTLVDNTGNTRDVIAKVMFSSIFDRSSIIGARILSLNAMSALGVRGYHVETFKNSDLPVSEQKLELIGHVGDNLPVGGTRRFDQKFVMAGQTIDEKTGKVIGRPEFLTAAGLETRLRALGALFLFEYVFQAGDAKAAHILMLKGEGQEGFLTRIDLEFLLWSYLGALKRDESVLSSTSDERNLLDAVKSGPNGQKHLALVREGFRSAWLAFQEKKTQEDIFAIIETNLNDLLSAESIGDIKSDISSRLARSADDVMSELGIPVVSIPEPVTPSLVFVPKSPEKQSEATSEESAMTSVGPQTSAKIDPSVKARQTGFAVVKDASALYAREGEALVKELLQVHNAAFNEKIEYASKNPMVFKIQTALQKNKMVIIADKKGHRVGYAMIDPLRNEWNHIDEVAVDPARRRSGIASLLLDEVLTRMLMASIHEFFLQVTGDPNLKDHAVALYENYFKSRGIPHSINRSNGRVQGNIGQAFMDRLVVLSEANAASQAPRAEARSKELIKADGVKASEVMLAKEQKRQLKDQENKLKTAMTALKPWFLDFRRKISEVARRKTAAAKDLGELGDPRAIPALKEALEDKNFHVRQQAAKAIKSIEDFPDRAKRMDLHFAASQFLGSQQMLPGFEWATAPARFIRNETTAMKAIRELVESVPLSSEVKLESAVLLKNHNQSEETNLAGLVFRDLSQSSKFLFIHFELEEAMVEAFRSNFLSARKYGGGATMLAVPLTAAVLSQSDDGADMQLELRPRSESRSEKNDALLSDRTQTKIIVSTLVTLAPLLLSAADTFVGQPEGRTIASLLGWPVSPWLYILLVAPASGILAGMVAMLRAGSKENNDYLHIPFIINSFFFQPVIYIVAFGVYFSQPFSFFRLGWLTVAGFLTGSILSALPMILIMRLGLVGRLTATIVQWHLYRMNRGRGEYNQKYDQKFKHITALGKMGEPGAAALMKIWDNEDNYTHQRILDVLSAIRPVSQEVVEFIIEKAKDPNSSSRWKPVEVLGNIVRGTSRELVSTLIIPALSRAVKDNRIYVRNKAIEALGKIQPVTPEVVFTLQKIIQDHDAAIRQEVETAIKANQQSEDGKQSLSSKKNRSEMRLEDTREERFHQALKDLRAGWRWNPFAVGAALVTQRKIASAMGILVDLGDPRAVPRIMAVLKSRDPYLRYHAAEALGELNDRQAVPKLIIALKDPVVRVRYFAAMALGKLNDLRAVPALIEALDDESISVRYAAAEVLGKLKDLRAVPGLKKLLKHENSSLRNTAATALGELEDMEALPALKELLKDPQAHVAEAAREAVGKILRAQKTVAAPLTYDQEKQFQQALRILQPEWGANLSEGEAYALSLKKAAAARTLGELGTRRAVPVLLTALQANEWQIRTAAAEALGKLSDDAAVPALIEALRDSDIYVRYFAAQALGELKDPRVFSELVEVLKKEEDYWVRQAIDEALGMIEVRLSETQEQQYRKAMRDLQSRWWDWFDAAALERKAAAATILGQLKDPAAVPALMLTLINSPWYVRAAIVEALGELKDPRALPALISILEDKYEGWYVRSHAAEALGKLKNPLALPALTEASTDKVWHVAYRAEKAVELIAGHPKKIDRLKQIRELPPEDREKAVTPRAEVRAPEKVEQPKKSVLVVEDYDDLREIFVSILEAEGYDVKEASDGEKALGLLETAKLSGTHFDLLMTDRDMPNMNGGELIKAVKPLYREMKILVVSGNDPEALGEEFLKKPVNLDDLTAKVKTLLSRSEVRGFEMAPVLQALDFDATAHLRGALETAKRITDGIFSIPVTKLKSFASVIARAFFSEHFSASAVMMRGVNVAAAQQVLPVKVTGAGHGIVVTPSVVEMGLLPILRAVYQSSDIFVVGADRVQERLARNMEQKMSGLKSDAVIAFVKDVPALQEAVAKRTLKWGVPSMQISGLSTASDLTLAQALKERIPDFIYVTSGIFQRFQLYTNGFIQGLVSEFQAAISRERSA